MAKTYTAKDILTLMDTNDYFVCACISKLYDRQTADEQQSSSTKHHNGRGFNAFDADFMSSLARQVRINKDKGTILSPKQLKYARKCLKKYVNQLVEIANEAQA